MASRELVVLGTAGQTPTRERNHHGLLLRLDAESVLIDCGEGIQRQFTHIGRSPSTVDHVLLTHLHGDHCLGIPGFLARRLLDQPVEGVHLHYPAEGDRVLDRLLDCTMDRIDPEVHRHPVAPADEPEPIGRIGDFQLEAARLDHTIPAVGYRLVEPDRRHFLTDRLEELGIRGPAVGRLEQDGRLDLGHRVVTLEEVTEPRRGRRIAFVFDTRECAGADALAEGADLLVCESTFADGEEDLAADRGHLTAGQAGRLAARAGARRLVLCHYSSRHPDEQVLAEQARRHHDDVVAAVDLMVVDLPEPHDTPT